MVASRRESDRLSLLHPRNIPDVLPSRGLDASPVMRT